MNNKNKRWTESEIQSLIKMRRAGKKNKEIAKKLERSTASISMQISKLRKQGVDIERRNDAKGAPLDNEFRKGTGGDEPETKSPLDVTLSKWADSSYHPLPKKKKMVKRKKQHPYELMRRQGKSHELASALRKVSILEDYVAKLEREKKALIKTLLATNELVGVYTNNDEE